MWSHKVYDPTDLKVFADLREFNVMTKILGWFSTEVTHNNRRDVCMSVWVSALAGKTGDGLDHRVLDHMASDSKRFMRKRIL